MQWCLFDTWRTEPSHFNGFPEGLDHHSLAFFKALLSGHIWMNLNPGSPTMGTHRLWDFLGPWFVGMTPVHQEWMREQNQHLSIWRSLTGLPVALHLPIRTLASTGVSIDLRPKATPLQAIDPKRIEQSSALPE